MKKLFVTTAVILTVWFAGNAQQLPMYSQYMMNGFLLNPAMAGTSEGIPLRLTARQQWAGINTAPLTVALSGHTLFASKKFGAGGYIFQDQFGPISRTGILGAYSYHMTMDGIDSKLSLGISVMAFQFKLLGNGLEPIDNTDMVVANSTETAIKPDANFGAYIHNTKYFAGVAATQLFQLSMDIGEVNTDNRMVRHYFVTGGYKFVLSKEFELEPSALLKATERTPLNGDINVRAIYKKEYWLGVSYRTGSGFDYMYDSDLVVMLGLKYKKIFFGYAFDRPFSTINNYTAGSHEIMIGYGFGTAEQGSSLL